jgi:transcription antitermination factor NusG
LVYFLKSIDLSSKNNGTEEQRSSAKMGDILNWYVVYTRPRWEKKVATMLEERGIESYCPLNKVYRQWSDRKKTIYEPLFKGYVFVHIDDEHKWEAKKIDGVLNFVYWNKKPAIVREEEIQIIKKFLNEFSEVKVENKTLAVSATVIIKQGVLMNYHGIVIEVIGNKAKVQIESMGIQLSAIFDKKNLELS